MREILFRGKRLDGGGWVEGSLYSTDTDAFILNALSTYAGSDYKQAFGDAVDPDTVGQYTGLFDKNGKRIFEGDVLQCGDIKCVAAFGEYRHVDKAADYPNGDVGFHVAFVCRESALSKRNDIVFWVRHGDAGVVGNVHDSPELEKGSLAGMADGVEGEE